MPHEIYMEQGRTALFDENKLCTMLLLACGSVELLQFIFNGSFSKMINTLALSVASSVQLEEVSSLT